MQHFEALFNRSASLIPPDIITAHTNSPTDVTPSTILEIRMSIRQTRSRKSSGPDNIPAESVNSYIVATENMLHIRFGKIWAKEKVPTDWNERYLIKISKKGDLSMCEKYGGVTLPSLPGKIFNRVLLNWIKIQQTRNIEIIIRPESVMIDCA